MWEGKKCNFTTSVYFRWELYVDNYTIQGLCLYRHSINSSKGYVVFVQYMIRSEHKSSLDVLYARSVCFYDSLCHCWLSLYKEATTHQVTTMQAISKNVLFPGHNHLLTTSADDPKLWLPPEHHWPGNKAFLEVTGMLVTWWIVDFLCSVYTMSIWQHTVIIKSIIITTVAGRHPPPRSLSLKDSELLWNLLLFSYFRDYPFYYYAFMCLDCPFQPL